MTTTTKRPRLSDPVAIEDYLRELHPVGSVFEIRVLPTPDERYPTILMGYFDDAKLAAAEIARVPRYSGVYTTINPANPALLSRAKNRLRKAGKGEATSDNDIVRRHWLPIDIDAVRPARVSSTDEEHKAAVNRLHAVMGELSDWAIVAAGVPTSSGNGAHLLFRVDLPADDGGIIESFLAALSAKYSDDVCKIDTSVHNPARIMRVCGTTACKGDSTDDRPHRMAERDGYPSDRIFERTAPVSLETIIATTKRLRAEFPQQEQARKQHDRNGHAGTFSVDDFIQRHNLDVDGPHAWQGGRKWILRTSPMCDHHDDGPHILEFPNGNPGAGCQHDSCRWGWLDLWRRLEPSATWQWPSGRRATGAADPGCDDADLPVDDPWPEPMDDAAFYGLVGDMVRTIEPHSEADPVALLVQTLVAFGSVIGRGPHFIAEADRHGCNLFTCLVGRTSKGRKGTSWGHVRTLVGAADPTWRDEKIQGGLSSGEGLIWAVRDPITRREKDKKGIYVEVTADPGIDDKRLVCIEEEFGGVLRIITRERNIVSTVMRQAWDGKTLRTMVKNNPAKATDPHVSVVGHVTRAELQQQIQTTDLANGFANRFLWVCIQRSKCLPEGGTLHTADMGPLVKRLTAAVDYAREVGLVTRDPAARELWASVYPDLSEGKPGLLGAATGRAEAITMRLAMIYALLDGSAIIRPEHLTAALAVWTYAEASARYAFGGAMGDPTADEILRGLRAAGAEGLTRRDLTVDVFQRHKTAAEIGRALMALLEVKLVRSEKRDTAGRPAEVWFART